VGNKILTVEEIERAVMEAFYRNVSSTSNVDKQLDFAPIPESAASRAERAEVNAEIMKSREVQELLRAEAEKLRKERDEEEKAAYAKASREAIAQNGRNAQRVSGTSILERQKQAMVQRGAPIDMNALKQQQRLYNDWRTEQARSMYTMSPIWYDTETEPKPDPIDFCKTPKRKFNFDE
jgi:hypothetical protein